jgi:NAD(P) transhydrogenase subunit beta
MSKAMNRSIFSKVFGGFGAESGGVASGCAQAMRQGVKSASVEDAFFRDNIEGMVKALTGRGH